MLLIVDGYNVICAWDSLIKMPVDQARDTLELKLKNYCGYKGYKFLVVYDAHMSSRKSRKAHCTQNVVFTSHGELADNYIERFVRDHSGEKMRVASSDSLLQVMIMSYAERLSARELIIDVETTITSHRVKLENKRGFEKNSLEDRLDEELLRKLSNI